MTALRQLWGQRNFRRLWIGQTLSAIGDQMIVVVIALYIVDRTGSARDLGIVLAAHALPLVLLIAVGGVWADRLPRQQIMIASDLIRCAVQVTTALLIFVDNLAIWQLAALLALFGAAEAFFRPAFTGLVPQTVPEAMIQEAQAVNYMSSNIAMFIGPAIAALIALSAGFGWAFLFDALTFAISAAMLLAVRARPRGQATEVRQSLRAELADGFHEVRSRQWVWVILLLALVGVFLSLAPFQAVGAVVARDQYGNSAVFGWLQAAAGVGTLLGAAVALHWRPLQPMRVVAGFFGAWPLVIVFYALGAPLWIVGPLFVANGFVVTLALIVWETALAERIPPQALSRVSSYDWMVSLALLPVGYLAAGLLGEHFDPSRVLLVGCVLALAAAPLTFLSPSIRSLRRLDPSLAEHE